MLRQQRIRKFIATLVICSVLMSALLGTSKPVVNAQSLSVIIEATAMDVAIAAVKDCEGRVTAEIDIINAVAADVSEDCVTKLANVPGIVRVTPDRSVKVSGDRQAQQTNVEFPKAIGVSDVWEQGNLGALVTVAILDTGIDTTFPTLRRADGSRSDRILAYYDALEEKTWSAPYLLRSSRDPNGHGTHVAGIIGNSDYERSDEEYRGIAPKVDFVAVRVLNEQGAGTYADVLQGINWVVQHKDEYNIRVMNVSMYAVPLAPYWADPYNLAVMAAWKAGIVVVASAGNTGPDPLSIGVPGNTPYVVTVGAFTDHRTPDDFGDDYIPEFSAAGPTLDAFVKPDVIAPGAHIVSLMRPNTYLREQYPEHRIDGHYFEMSGTSMSTAMVSGVAALMISENPDLTPDQVKYRLMQTARPQFSEVNNSAAYSIWQQGAGRVWAYDAVYADIEGQANLGLDIDADLAGDMHYQGWTTWDADAGVFTLPVAGEDGWITDFTTWDGSYTNFVDGYGTWSEGDTNWSDEFATWTEGFGSWADGFGSWADGFGSWADGFGSWADGFGSWADTCEVTQLDGFGSWADGFGSWADGFGSWADGFGSWADGFGSWADSLLMVDELSNWALDFSQWADAFVLWAEANASQTDYCQNWVDGFGSWADGFGSWADGFGSWADGFGSWADSVMDVTGASETWTGGYLTWSDGFGSWADGFGSWADACGVSETEGFGSWADGFGSWADGFGSWADGFGSWADGFGSWADFIVWLEGFGSWADGFGSWADDLETWAYDSLDDTRPVFCGAWIEGFGSWADGFGSWADGFGSWADGFGSWADGVTYIVGESDPWSGGYTDWVSELPSLITYRNNQLGLIIDPEWADAYKRLENVRDENATTGINMWVDSE